MTATTLKLSDLAGPDADGWADVAVFVYSDGTEGHPFVAVCPRGGGGMEVVDVSGHHSTHFDNRPVRRLGRGRLVPARIEMEGEAGLAAQVKELRGFLSLHAAVFEQMGKPRLGEWNWVVLAAEARAALAATSLTPSAAPSPDSAG